MSRYTTSNRGTLLIELLVTVGILGFMIIAVGAFEASVLFNNKYVGSTLSSAQDARTILRTIVKELRSSAPGNNGAYPIAQTATSSVTFFSDSDGDGLKEQIRYFLSGSTLKRGSIVPTGSPLTYVSVNEKISILASNIKNEPSTALFEYYDDSYTGTSSSLAQPVTVTSVHLVKIILTIDDDPNSIPIPRTFTSQVTLRNLKDNL